MKPDTAPPNRARHRSRGPRSTTVPASPAPARKVAALVTVYRHNSHAELIAGRLLRTDTLDDKGNHSPLKLVSLYTDQRPTNDVSRRLAASYGFRISETIEDALTLGTGRLAVDGVLLIAEHGEYAKSPTGKRRDSGLTRIVRANYPVSKSRAQLTSPDVKSDTRSKDSRSTTGACGGTYCPQLISKTLARLQPLLE